MVQQPSYRIPLLEGGLLDDGNTDDGNVDLTMPNSIQDFSIIEMPDPIAQQQDFVPTPTLPPPSPPPPPSPAILVSSGIPSCTHSNLSPLACPHSHSHSHSHLYTPFLLSPSFPSSLTCFLSSPIPHSSLCSCGPSFHVVDHLIL